MSIDFFRYKVCCGISAYFNAFRPPADRAVEDGPSDSGAVGKTSCRHGDSPEEIISADQVLIPNIRERW
jgi:hypothetical protein